MKKIILSMFMLIMSLAGLACSTPTTYGATVLNAPCTGDSITFMIYGNGVGAFVLSGTFTFPDPIFPISDTTILRVLPMNSTDTGVWDLEIYDDCFNPDTIVSTGRVMIRSKNSVVPGSINSGPDVCAGSTILIHNVAAPYSVWGTPVSVRWQYTYISTTYPLVGSADSVVYVNDSNGFALHIFERLAYESGCPIAVDDVRASDSTNFHYLGTTPLITAGLFDTLTGLGIIHQGGAVNTGDFTYYLIRNGVIFRDSIGKDSAFSWLQVPEGVYKVVGIDSNTGCGRYILGTVVFDLGTALPVEITPITVLVQSRSVVLSWGTYTETNNNCFRVQRSADAIHFKTIGVVRGHGNSTESKTYSFEDSHPIVGINYYQLLQIDNDGASTTTDIVSATFSSNLSLAYADGKIMSEGIVEIYDLNGRLAMRGSGEVSLEKLDPGFYVAISLTTGEKIKFAK